MPATTNDSAVTALGQVALTVNDVARSTAFYRDTVGLRFLFAAGPSLAFFDIGGVRLMLSAPEGTIEPGGGAVVYLKVADIMAAYAEMQARGLEFEDAPHLIASMPDHDLWMTFFRDPDGNMLALMAERAKTRER